MGLADLTLGWDQDAKGIDVTERDYFGMLSSFGGETRPTSGVIRGWTFRPTATTEHGKDLAEIIRTVVFHLRDS